MIAILAGTAGLLIICTAIVIIVIARTSLSAADTNDVPTIVRTICRALETMRHGRRS
ncbi:hypothetical protein ACIOEX_01560 [Streptomyces sp. NPDC087850]|uniref:hypothetical protein n=1 Tax=Streptomyces sp. NPDC087850 TaxID=3365809 RepID=UPI0037F691CE